MDRGRHRAFLGVARVSGVMILALAGSLLAQNPTPPANLATATATPWVQASPPLILPSTKSLHNKVSAQVSSPLPTTALGVSSNREEVAREMARKREEELAKQSPPVGPPRNLPQLTPEEKEAYERNLTFWLALPPEERQAIRGEATERIRVETEKAYESSGLHLNNDQREVFALRYRQERRRLERELQEKARAERERRLPEILERIKREFPAAASAVNPPKLTPAPTPVVSAISSPAK